MKPVALCVVAITGASVWAQSPARPWMDAKLPPDQRAELVLKQLTLDEKVALLHGEGMPGWKGSPANLMTFSNGGAGVVEGVERLGIPRLQISDAAYGVRASADNGRYSTALPSNVASAASWDIEAACSYGTLIGKELREQGYNMTLGGGANLTREPRNGRTFEYMGEDPLLAGTMVGNRIRCEQAQHVIGHLKHYALNDQESGRNQVNVRIDEKAMRESDLLAFQIALQVGKPSAVMCSYNGVNGDYVCENRHLLTDVLKHDWGFQGFVISDWQATHSTEKASAAGLDQQQPLAEWYGEPLKQAVTAGRVPMAELDDHVRRVLWAEFNSGIIDDPAKKGVVDAENGLEVARRAEEQSAVLLKNSAGVLPLDRATLKSMAIIGPHADTGMISGGGSAQVDAPGTKASAPWRTEVWFPTSPLNALKAKVPAAKVSFASGENIAEAVAQAKAAEVAVVFVYQWQSEDADLPNLSLPGNQDALVAAVTAANPRTVVVLETGTAVLMPWLQRASAVMEAWYGGSKGADAVANLLFGDVNPSGKLPMTFPLSEADLPHPVLVKPPAGAKAQTLAFSVNYSEGNEVGYKWYESQHKPVLFPFGFGLSYTSFKYSGLQVAPDLATASFTVTNTGKRTGAEIAEVYATVPEAGQPKRLVGWQKVELAPGESRMLYVKIEPLTTSVWQDKWVRQPGSYTVMVGGSSAELPLKAVVAAK